MIDLVALEAQARERLSTDAYTYISRGAGDGDTLAENERAWRRLALRPRVLHDVSEVSAAVSVLGDDLGAPVLVAPTAMHQLCDPDGECATVRGADAAGTVMVVSMAATRSYEEVAAAAPDAKLWAQMYMLRDRGRTRTLAERARDAGYRAIVATVDGASVPHGHARLGSTVLPRRAPRALPPSSRRLRTISCARWPSAAPATPPSSTATSWCVVEPPNRWSNDALGSGSLVFPLVWSPYARARRPAQRRDRRPRRPRQDHARRRPALAVRRVPRQPGRQRAGHGLERPRAREGHHDPRQEHGGPRTAT